MARFRLLLINEFKLVRTAVPIHLVAIVQPSVLFLCLSLILVHPTFEVNVTQPTAEEGWALVEAMRQVRTPDGVTYIEPILVAPTETSVEASTEALSGIGALRQVITIKEPNGVPTAVQRYGLIDSNQVKNLRNRLTVAALRLWNATLGERAVSIKEHAWLPRDVPYPVYFGMALLPVAAFVAASFIGAVLTAQDFEFKTALEYRLSPISPALILGARLVRLVLSSLFAASLLLVVAGFTTGFWPVDLWRFIWVLLLVAIIASSMGLLAGLLFRSTFPAYVTALGLSIASWIFGNGFALASGFGGLYELISRLTPNAHAVELLFPVYYGVDIGNPTFSILMLAAFSLVLLALLIFTYHWRMVRQQ